MIFRPATPGFLVTLIATILLAIVSFNAPIIKSQYFLRASLSVENINGSLDLGTLGYCLNLSNGTTCTKPAVGYEFDPNALLGDNIKFAQIPQVVVKWLTYALFLHVIALIGAAVSAVFGLLAHVREMSMAYCSTCFSGIAAAVALVAFIFDLAFFFTVKSRINSVQGGSATIGNSIWITLAAWLLLFFSGCFYACGRCCIQRRPRGNEGWWGGNSGQQGGFFGNRNAAQGGDPYTDQMRMEAIRAEQARKDDQTSRKEQGLPAFPELDRSSETKPLATAQYLEEEEDEHPSNLTYRDNNSTANLGSGAPPARRQASGGPQAYRGGYAQGAPGTRAVDEYNNVAGAHAARRQSSSTYSRSNYAPSVTTNNTGNNASRSPPPGLPGQQSQFLAVGGQGGHSQYLSTGQQLGHGYGGSSYHTAATQHTQYPSHQTAYNDPYSTQQPSTYNDPYSSHTQQPSFNPDSYNQAGVIGGFINPTASPPQNSISPPPTQPSIYSQPSQHAQDRSYTLGGGGYGGSTVPNIGAAAYATHSPSPPTVGAYGGGYTASPPSLPVALTTSLPVSGNTPYTSSPVSTAPSGMQGYASSTFKQPNVAALPQPQHSHSGGSSYEDSPPGYEAGPAQPAGAWSEKGPR
ncbi:pali-domain-containing protein [Schizopora paradoxa]|uniref:Pali-domain-containing protein n=1 Tax=Schizopora paradoxa TaxID=27342 RepID=A0A0H2RBA4_9AGAM|nr:pali-domain-containing protein [Schizopora paradoxa]